MSGQLLLVDSPPPIGALPQKGYTRASKHKASKQYLLLMASCQQVKMLRAVVSVRFGVSYHNGILINAPQISIPWLEENYRLLVGCEQWERETHLQASSPEEETRGALVAFFDSRTDLSVRSVLPVQHTEDWRLLLALALEFADPTLTGAEYRAQFLPQPEP